MQKSWFAKSELSYLALHAWDKKALQWLGGGRKTSRTQTQRASWLLVSLQFSRKETSRR